MNTTGYYADYDDDTALWCVFHVDSPKALASFLDKRDAEEEANRRNKEKS